MLGQLVVPTTDYQDCNIGMILPASLLQVTYPCDEGEHAEVLPRIGCKPTLGSGTIGASYVMFINGHVANLARCQPV